MVQCYYFNSGATEMVMWFDYFLYFEFDGYLLYFIFNLKSVSPKPNVRPRP
jgi:hypothetical protein